MKKIEVDILNEQSWETLEFNCKIYPLDVIKKSAYKFTDRFVFKFSIVDEKAIVNLRMYSNSNREDVSDGINQFYNEILDQDLRNKISQETESIRNLILANAFSNTKLINS